jgi:predicted Zn-dependent protease
MSLRSFLSGTAFLAACTMVGGCTTNPHSERAQLVAPTLVSAVYSDTNLRAVLALTPNIQTGCEALACPERDVFDARVVRLGKRVAEAAFRAYPELAGRIPGFDFHVVDKAEPGTASTAGGLVVVMRPLGALTPEDDTLSFLLAREIGHVVAQHHEENTGAGLMASALATVLLPVASVASVLATLFSGTSPVAASASVTAASFAGSRALAETYRPRQREEADDIALRLLGALGYDAQSVVAGFARVRLDAPPTRWMGDLRASLDHVALQAARAAAAKAYASLPIQAP